MKKIIIAIIGLILGLVTPEVLNYFQSPSATNITSPRIISLTPAQTKTLDYLGLGQYIVGISSFDENPKYQHLPKIKGGIAIDEEDILALNPNTIMIGDIKNHQENQHFFQKQGIKTIGTPTKSLNDIRNSMLTIQEAFPQFNFSNKIEDFDTELAQLKATTPKSRQTIFVVLSINPIYSISTNTYLHEFFSLIGWDNVVQTKASYPILTEEDLLSIPDVDLMVFPKYRINILEQLTNDISVNAKQAIMLDDDEWQHPSPYLLESIKKLRNKYGA